LHHDALPAGYDHSKARYRIHSCRSPYYSIRQDSKGEQIYAGVYINGQQPHNNIATDSSGTNNSIAGLNPSVCHAHRHGTTPVRPVDRYKAQDAILMHPPYLIQPLPCPGEPELEFLL